MWHARPGDEVTEGEPLFTLLTDEPERFDRALASLEGGYDIGDGASAHPDRPALRDRPHRFPDRAVLPNSGRDPSFAPRPPTIAPSVVASRGAGDPMTNVTSATRAARTMRTPVLVVLLLVTGVVVGGGAAYLLMSRDGTSAAGADTCGAYETVEVTVDPSSTARS